MKNIGVVTGTRADYGILKPLISRLHENDNVNLHLFVTGMHLSQEFGMTVNEIKKDNFSITEEVEILLSSDSKKAMIKSMGLAMISFSDILEKYNLDIIIILGDRFEALAIAITANTLSIPIAHIHGGEITEGAIDEGFRHSITKFSQLHFASTEEYRKRIIQLGENPKTVFNVGAMGIENIKTLSLLSKEDVYKNYKLNNSKELIICTYHPETLSNSNGIDEVKALIKVLKQYSAKYNIIITKSNADANGRIYNVLWDEFADEYDDVHSFYSLGMYNYLSVVKHSKFVIGNSSSGIIEVPSFGIPTINIGNRQRGRVQAKSVINTTANISDIKNAIEIAINSDFSNVINPYEGFLPSKKIFDQILSNINNLNLDKTFFDIEVNLT
ncbi:UDP-N-acetylglucosamine 2-epimerase (hydrolyzing) [Macrococcoides canis]|uniref:UDP-N-acetylglucosamine 2-epimerase n=1 Tax=Macrococcoides canis TaxID=1855823 RepID=UPI0020B64A2E|nr:UDP-N-acetylglucosamine 2-epimerase [Macrococcus canis]UTH00867.1 UDP-N-acetylglucosamine 2-epimerase (hydrolyzing) [Macrococcus canis]UTH03232.1 UDP-N-acetylglucosamine 2-epimerase (hydrolyzing) [Macrococcus canis]